VFAAADYSQFELRTLSQVCIFNGWKSRMGEALNSGFDPHLEVAALILGISYEDALERHKAADDEVYRARQTGKVANFGYPGGLGYARLVEFAKSQYGVIINEDEARELKQHWYQAWPEMEVYLNWIGQLCEEESPIIKQIYSNRFRGGMGFCDTANTFFQGLAADAAKSAGFLIARECYTDRESVLYGSRLVNFVHDEFILEVLEAVAAEAAERLAELMCEGAAPFLPDVPPVAEPLLMRRWSKKAKEIRDENGRLVPWEREAA
jgi:DNA polymerase-1